MLQSRKFIVIAAVLCICLKIVTAYRISTAFTKRHQSDGSAPCGQPLYLTPYLRYGKIDQARKLSRVSGLPDAPSVPGYSGFFTVDEKYNSNIFFWFIPASDGNQSAPLLLWLQGGPGLTSLFGFFVENGPYFVWPNMTADLREHAWTRYYHVIYADNPVGAGFSFTDDQKGYVINEDQMAEGMHAFLVQFFQMFPEYKHNEFYIAGESYAGKYVPALSYRIHTERNTSKINLAGMIIGNGLCDPETMMDYGDYVFQLGLVDRRQADVMRNLSNTIVQQIRKKNYMEALVGFSNLLVSFNVISSSSYFKNFTQFNFLYNYLLTEEPSDFEYYRKYLESPEVRKALHVGNLTFQDGKVAQKHLLLDIMQSVKPNVQEIMDSGYRVLFYSGQLDLVIPYPMTVNFLSSVKWKYAQEYREANRLIWKLKDSDFIAGFVHNVGDFYEVLVRNAGHIVPYDQPKSALDLLSRFLNRQSFA